MTWRDLLIIGLAGVVFWLHTELEKARVAPAVDTGNVQDLVNLNAVPFGASAVAADSLGGS